MKGINPADVCRKVIPGRTEKNTEEHNNCPERETPQNSFPVNMNRSKRFMFGFKQHKGFFKYKRNMKFRGHGAIIIIRYIASHIYNH